MSIEKLVKDLKNGGGLTRAKAAALGKLGDKGAIRPLIDALQDNNAGVRNNAAFALGELEAKEAVPQLAALLNDIEEWARKSAANDRIERSGRPAGSLRSKTLPITLPISYEKTLSGVWGRSGARSLRRQPSGQSLTPIWWYQKSGGGPQKNTFGQA